MAANQQTYRAEGAGLEAHARPRPLVMIVGALAILVLIGAIWIGFAGTSQRHPDAPAIPRASATDVVPAAAASSPTDAPRR
jgi:hypothetical protein